MTSPDDVRERAFEAGVKTRGAVETVKNTAGKAKEKIESAIEGSIDSAQSGFKEGPEVIANSAANIVSSALLNKKGFIGGVFFVFSLTVIWFGIGPALGLFGSIGGGAVAGGLSGKPLNSDNKVANFTSHLGSGINRAVFVGGQAIGEAASSAYQYQPVNNTTQPSFVGGNIRPGSINPYPQQPVVPIQMQHQPPQQSIAVNQYNPNVYYQPRR